MRSLINRASECQIGKGIFMTIYNKEIAEKFNKLANLLEIEGANPFRIRAYRNAARMISGLSKNISDLVKQGKDLSELPGIGKDLAEKMTHLVKTGKFPLLSQIESRTPVILNELMQIEGLGPKRVQTLYHKLNIKNRTDLENKIKKGRLRELKGFGEKVEQKILQGIKHLGQYEKRAKLIDVLSIVNTLIAYFKQCEHVEQIECAGSFRR